MVHFIIIIYLFVIFTLFYEEREELMVYKSFLSFTSFLQCSDIVMQTKIINENNFF